MMGPSDLDFDDEPIVPRSSKQAKMLGVGVDTPKTSMQLRGSIAPGSNAAPNGASGGRGRVPDQHLPPMPNGSTPNAAAMGSIDGLQGWNGWGTGAQTAGRTDTQGIVPPWASSNNSSSNDRKGKSPAATPGSRAAVDGSRDAAPSSTAPPSKKKKTGFGLGFLKRGASRQDVREDYTSDSASFVDLAPPRSFGDAPLPAKLQARGDAVDSLPQRVVSAPAKGKKDKKDKKSSTPVRPTPNRGGSTTPVGRHQSVFTVDPEISLDTNLNSMEGIIDFNALNNATNGSNGSNGAPAGALPSSTSLMRSPSSGSNLEPRDFSSNNVTPDPSNRLSNYSHHLLSSRRSSADPSSSDAETIAMGASQYKRDNSLGGFSSGSGSGIGPLSGIGSLHQHHPQPLTSATPASAAHSSPAPLPSTSGMPARPGILRSSSGVSTTYANLLAASGHRRPSGVPALTGLDGSGAGSATGGSASGISGLSRGAAAAAAAAASGVAAGAWTAPDSWAVKAESNALDHDSSDDDDGDGDDDHDQTEELESETGLDMSPDGGHVKAFGAGGAGGAGAAGILGGHSGMNGSGSGVDGEEGGPIVPLGRPMTSNGRPGTKAGRPGTADGGGGFRAGQGKSFMIRIHRPDSTFSTLPVPLTVTAAELVTILARRFQVTSNSQYTLYLREKGTERRITANEKPVLLQKRRFEQAGYTELDKLEELGREDNAYLCKLVYKPTPTTLSAATIGEEVIGESLEFVDLSGKCAETIPIFLYRHAHEIVSLNLSKNRPFELPTDFVQLCTSLRELVLSHMGIKRIPQAVKECVSLTRLDISNNNIVDLEHIALDELDELMSLKCHNNRLWTLPEYFSSFKLLKYLNLSNNRFESIPAVVPKITSLVELDISFNTIVSVPPEVGQLTSLERLVLLANSINSLPPTLNNLAHLKELDCRRNAIADLSPIAGVPQLEVLRCEHNQASILEATWSHMRVLTASNNSLTRFALSGTSNSLTSLNLSYAKLSTLATDMFDHLGSVENLVFDSNQIRVLPDGVGSLSNLITLSIKNNLLTHIPESIGKLQRLQTLQVSGNNLPTLPAEIWLCSQLTVLNASSNLMDDFPDPPLTTNTTVDPADELDSRKLSSISKAPSTSSGRIAPPLALSLQKLYLGDNRCTDDVLAPISLMTELRILNLSFNDIAEIPSSSLFRLQQLEELYLSGNKLMSLPPDDLERLVNLRLIYLNGNKLQTLPAELGKIKKLYALDVGNNILKYNIANWPYDWNWNWNLELRYLNLSGNKRLEIKPGHQNDTTALPRSAKRRNLADFSALTKLRILGLMDVTLMIPSVPDESEDRRVRTSLSEINDIGYGIADTLGQRHDVLSLIDIVIPRFRSKDDEAIFGLFDAVNKGQNTGAKLVKYLQDSFTAIFTLELSRLKSGEVTSDALRRAFLGINRDYGNMLLPASDVKRKDSEISLTDRTQASARTGAAGIIVYIRKKRMYVANAGNALAIIADKKGKHRLIAKRHEPFDAAEIARIRTAEGWISHRGYVNDEVDISRSFGFYNVFPAINAAPNIDEIELEEMDEFVIIANRGLWEHMSYQAAVDVARTERGDPMAAAAKLRDLAISYGSSQNIMVMVLSIGDLFDKTKKRYGRGHRGAAHPNDDEGFYGQHRTGAALRRGREEGAGERYLNLLDREVAPPTGMVALVFTDIRNSTALWESNPGMQTAIRMHNQLLRRQLRAIGGYEVKTEGDAFMVSFPTVTSALLWCLTVQLELLREDWPQEILDSEEGKEIVNSRGEILYRGLSVRMGIHWGAPVCEADPITRRMDYFGPMVNRSARISAVAEGGQISASQDVIDIIQDVVMESRPEPSSLDSDSGEEPEEEWLDNNEKQDVLALRRLGFGISALGERKLKGLETAEVISLIWPKALKERIKTEGGDKDKVQAEIYDPSLQILDVALVKTLGRLTQRLEAAAAAIVHRARDQQEEEALAAAGGGQVVLAQRQVLIHPTSLAPIIRPDSTDDELTALLEGFLQRIENCLSTMVLHQLGPFTEVLSALGQAVRLDPRSIMLALTRYAGVLGVPPTTPRVRDSPQGTPPAVALSPPSPAVQQRR